MTVAIFIPISRADHLDRLFAALEVMTCDPKTTSLFTYVDGDQALFLKARNLTEGSKFEQRLCVQRAESKSSASRHSIEGRRIRISEIHNEAKMLIGDCKYVFGLEDDTIPPPSALQKLLTGYAAYPHAGFIEGVELGRWGIPYVGAWRADDVYEPTTIESLLPALGRQEIDAGGFYCYLTKREHFVGHTYEPFDGNQLGPDVQYGLWLRQQGLKNYIDWSLIVEHRVMEMGEIRTITVTSQLPLQVQLVRRGEGNAGHDYAKIR
jgi:hypothetical protein